MGSRAFRWATTATPEVAERVLAQGDADLIGIGRGLIADPNWVRKVWYGREGEIRKCISCNIGCAGNRISSNIPIRCTVNPDVVGGDAYLQRRVNKPCNVVVIGGGTAGLEAACTAAEVGCSVFLLEEKEELGGLSTVIAKIPEKPSTGRLSPLSRTACREAQEPRTFSPGRRRLPTLSPRSTPTSS